MIRIEGLTKRFGKFTAVSELDLYIPKGSVFGFVGPNGAGKTTTMSILATLLEPTSGRAFVGDYDVTVHPRAVRQLIGYMPDFFGVYDNLKVTEYLDFYAGAYEIPVSNRAVLIRDLLDLVNLSDKVDSYVDHLSRGMKQRLGLARSLVHDPEVLILDEPASGLDPRARIEMKEILKELRRMGKTILISSHILPELAEMCTDIGVIENGKLVAVGSVDEIASKVYESRLLRIKLLPTVTEAQLQRATALLKGKQGVRHFKVSDNTLEVAFDGTEQDQQLLLAALVQEQLPVVSLSEDTGNLEDIFLAITKGVGS
ncbi:ABC transporter ATP-binding protein [Effusibacillus lacus]|uniref:ABC transporter n=1 Tax=Effusibacillus lacus TaxID=1348429 RepID=A0A292YRT1_9BACL|nr:ABC transporter ATP-binding protein [Effusibacillus lacus]TCS76343.1 ABC-2 type transport system ATP-binding protein [Effusibacillus lacus]GAX91886.1 ABC transporter [Effusibacillus lacus]